MATRIKQTRIEKSELDFKIIHDKVLSAMTILSAQISDPNSTFSKNISYSDKTILLEHLYKFFQVWIETLTCMNDKFDLDKDELKERSNTLKKVVSYLEHVIKAKSNNKSIKRRIKNENKDSNSEKIKDRKTNIE